MKLQYFVGHRRPEFPMWDGFTYVGAPAGASGGKSFEQAVLDHTLFNEYASLFALRKSLSAMADLDGQRPITIAQHRRFVLNRKVGRQSLNQPWVMVVGANEARALRITDEYLPLPGNSYLLGSPYRPSNGMFAHYARFHRCRDILRFTAALVDGGFFTDSDALAFVGQRDLIPSPSCGTFTLVAFLSVFEMLEEAARIFWNDGYKPYQDGYQGRVCSFLLERLNSYLLLRYFHEHRMDINKVFGQTVVVSDDLSVSAGRISDAQ